MLNHFLLYNLSSFLYKQSAAENYWIFFQICSVCYINIASIFLMKRTLWQNSSGCFDTKYTTISSASRHTIFGAAPCTGLETHLCYTQKRFAVRTRVSRETFAVFPSTVTLRTEPSFELTQSSPNMSLKQRSMRVRRGQTAKLCFSFY